MVKVSLEPAFMVSVYLFNEMPITKMGLTVTTQSGEEMFDPSVEVALIFAVPGATAVTLPDESTVATPELFDDHINARFVAFEGVTVAVKISLEPTVMVSIYLFNEMPETKMGLTVITQG